jgi:hypothetical protein
MRTTSIFILSIILTFVSCGFGGGSEEIHLVGKYYVGWVDMESTRTIYFKDNAKSPYQQWFLPGYVFAVGNDSRYIIAKTIDGPDSEVEYHIIDSKGYYHTNMDYNNYWSFSSEDRFYRALDSMRITTIKFDKNFRKDPWN